MHRTLAAMCCWLVLVSLSRADPPAYLGIPGNVPPWTERQHRVKDWGPLDYNDDPGAVPGGLVFIRQGNQRIWRFGGGLLPMRVKVTEPGPEGPVTTRMVFPSAAQSPFVPFALQGLTPPVPASDRACVRVQMPDPEGLLYIGGQLTDTEGASRQVQSPPLGDGQSHVFRLRAAFKVGENLLIEDKQITVQSGQTADVTFTGERALAVPLPGAGPGPVASRP
jgi:uncharacterized protein (TIGR03000 family)